MNSNEVNREETQNMLNQWSEQNEIKEFIPADDVSANVLRRLRGLEEDGLVWHQVMTNDGGWSITPGVDWFGLCDFCSQLDHLESKCKGSKGFGWTTVGFFVANNSSPQWDEFWVPDGFPCALCNSDSSFDSLDDDCPDCEGEGLLSVDYQWPG
jgi:hypothetical protein